MKETEEFIAWLEKEKSLCSLAITACGVTHYEAKFVYEKQRKRFQDKIDELRGELTKMTQV